MHIQDRLYVLAGELDECADAMVRDASRLDHAAQRPYGYAKTVGCLFVGVRISRCHCAHCGRSGFCSGHASAPLAAPDCGVRHYGMDNASEGCEVTTMKTWAERKLMADEQVFTEVTAELRVAHATDTEMYVIFGDPQAPRHVEMISRTDTLKAGVALAASAAGRPVYSPSLIAAVFNGSLVTRPPLRVKVVVASDDGEIYSAHLYGVTDRTITISVGMGDDEREITKDVQPLQILHMDVGMS